MFQRKELKDGEYVEINYLEFEDSREMAKHLISEYMPGDEDLINEYMPGEKEDIQILGFVEDYKVVEIIFLDNEKYYIIDDIKRNKLILVHDNKGRLSDLYDKISEKVNSLILGKYFNGKKCYYVESGDENFYYVEQSEDIKEFKNEAEVDELEIELEGEKFELCPVIYRDDKGHIKVVVDCRECMDILISLIKKNYTLKEKIDIDY